MSLVMVRADGGVSIATPAPDPLDVPAFIAKWEQSAPGQNIVSYHTTQSIPQGRDFREAWESGGGVLSVGLTKAKEITKTRLRKEREPLFAAQDAAYMKALETAADTTAIVIEKNRLRDLPLGADSAKDLTELRALKAAK